MCAVAVLVEEEVVVVCAAVSVARTRIIMLKVMKLRSGPMSVSSLVLRHAAYQCCPPRSASEAIVLKEIRRPSAGFDRQMWSVMCRVVDICRREIFVGIQRSRHAAPTQSRSRFVALPKLLCLNLETDDSVTPVKGDVLQLSGAFDLQHHSMSVFCSSKLGPELLDRFDRRSVERMQNVTRTQFRAVRIQFW